MTTRGARIEVFIGWAAIGCLLLACQATPTATPAPTQASAAASLALQEVSLPAPRLSGAMSLEETLSRRRSVREYSKEALTTAELSQLLWACNGVTHSAGLRTAPSAGALYPLEVYVATAEGVSRYVPQGHSLQRLDRADMRAALSAAAMGQAAVAQSPAVFIIAAVYQRTAQKYGDRAPLYVHLEAGHAAQNLLLQAVALGLGGVPIGAVYEQKIQEVLRLPADHQPVYIIAIGHPSS